jgi:putative hydrolase of the HAD superfamily
MRSASLPRSIRCVSFDLYGTLLRYDDLEQSWREWRATLESHVARAGAPLSGAELDALCHRFFQGEAPASDGLSVFESRLALLSNQLGLTLGRRELARIADDCCRSWQRSISLDPQCKDTLAQLTERYPLVLVTNFDHPRHVHTVLEELGIRPLFRGIYISGEHGIKKPDARLVALTRELARYQPADCVHVGDSLDDYHFARNAGMLPVMLSTIGVVNGNIDYMERERRRVDDALHIDQLTDLCELLDIAADAADRQPTRRGM